MNKKIIWVLIVVVAVAVGLLLYNMLHEKAAVSPLTNSTSSVSETSSVLSITNTNQSTTTAPAFTSSSTAQIGTFTVVTDCVIDQRAGGNIIRQINISKGNIPVQTISANFDTEVYACPQAQSQDVNFDGNPDIVINTGHGATGNEDYNFWIYSTSTGQFGCPYNATAGSEACTLGGDEFPVFDTASETITTHWNNGCAGLCTDEQTFQIMNGEMVLIKDVSVDQSYITSTKSFVFIKTTKELMNGQLVVVSTSTVAVPGAD